MHKRSPSAPTARISTSSGPTGPPGPAGTGLAGGSQIAISPDGNTIYAVSPSKSTLAVLHRAGGGALSEPSPLTGDCFRGTGAPAGEVGNCGAAPTDGLTGAA